jgi:DNA-binding response OmpR family regulator
MQKVLLVEDDLSISVPLKSFLEEHCYFVMCASTLSEARKILGSSQFDAILLDRSLPDGDGLSILHELRQGSSQNSKMSNHSHSANSAHVSKTAVLVLTAKVEVLDRVYGFEVGADDYITKPFDSRELLARLRARTRSAENSNDADLLVCGKITLSRRLFKVQFNGSDLQLNLKEFELLEYFMKNSGAALSRETLLLKVWGMRYASSRTLDVHVASLRQKTSSNCFETIHGLGYRFRAPE